MEAEGIFGRLQQSITYHKESSFKRYINQRLAFARVAQLVVAFVLHTKCRQFESVRGYFGTYSKLFSYISE